MGGVGWEGLWGGVMRGRGGGVQRLDTVHCLRSIQSVCKKWSVVYMLWMQRDNSKAGGLWGFGPLHKTVPTITKCA